MKYGLFALLLLFAIPGCSTRKHSDKSKAMKQHADKKNKHSMNRMDQMASQNTAESAPEDIGQMQEMEAMDDMTNQMMMNQMMY